MSSEWKPIESAPRDGTPFLMAYEVNSNDINGYVPWGTIPVVIAWWDGDGWECSFMYDGAADTYGSYFTHYHSIPTNDDLLWMPLPLPPARDAASGE